MSFFKKPFHKFKDASSSGNTSTTGFDSEASKTEGIDDAVSPSSDTKLKSHLLNSNALAQALNGTLLGKGRSNGRESGTSTPDSGRQSREIIDRERVRRSMDAARTKADNKKREAMARMNDERFLAEGPPELTKLYKPLSMNMSKRWDHEARVRFADLDFASKL